MDLGGLSMENFPPVAGNDSKTLRKLSLLEARMVGAGNESREGSLPPNDGSRGSDNNSNSMSTIGFPKPRSYLVASPDNASRSSARRSVVGNGFGADSMGDDAKGSGKRKAPADGPSSPLEPPFPSQGSVTASTQDTSPGESRLHGHGGEDGSGWKRARAGGTPVSLPPPPPPRSSNPLSDGDKQAPHGTSSVGPGVKAQHGHARRPPRGADGAASPTGAQAPGKAAPRPPWDRNGQGRDVPRPARSAHGLPPRAGAEATAVGGGVGGGENAPASLAATTAGTSSDASPQSGTRGGRGPPAAVAAAAATAAAAGPHGALGAATKTIQSYFLKPSNGSAMQALAASYTLGEPGAVMDGGAGLSKEVDLSGADQEGQVRFDRSPAETPGRSGRNGSIGRASLSGGVSLQQRFSTVASGDEGGGQGQGQGQGQKPTPVRGQGAPGACAARGVSSEKKSAHGVALQEEFESALSRLREAESSAKRLQKDLDRANLELSSMKSMAETLQKQLDTKIEEFKVQEDRREKQRTSLTSVVEALLRKVSAQEASDCRARLARDSLQLGKIVSVKTGHIGKYVEAFEEGSSFKEVERKMSEVVSKRSKLEGRKRAVARLLKASASSAAAEGQSDEQGRLEAEQARLEAVEEEETVRMHLAALKREELALQEEKRDLDARKVLHIRELKRVAHEDRSKFVSRPTLSGRYVLLDLLGKGGFSEVWRAFDLVHARDVAVKVHQLLNNWNESQKANFIRHVTREYEIHQQMRHPRIVNLTDVFEICCDSFATVLDYCRGTDLECVLRERKQLPERDARALILQVARGLQYLNTAQVEGSERRGAIIHYDLKPGNILLDENGDVKITDFGLSKILEIKRDTERGTGGGTSMELTSKGAGTYWYLPPECFGDNPRISSKVDVWSLGVVFYQMLYGVRPFGEGLSQEKILREKVIVNANRVDFPPKPTVSEEAKSFIRSCLTYTDATRPDVHTMCSLPYLTTPLPKRGAS